jgi:hypothetical protein
MTFPALPDAPRPNPAGFSFVDSQITYEPSACCPDA